MLSKGINLLENKFILNIRMKKILVIIYEKNTPTPTYPTNIDYIYIDPEPYYDFSQIKDKIQQYEYIVFIDDTLDYDELYITKSIEFLIQYDLDQFILNNSETISSTIMEYDYYKRIIISNKIFKNLTKKDIKQIDIQNNYKSIQYILYPSIIRTKNFILPDFFLKKNPHIENLYWTELLKNGFKISNQNPPENYKYFRVNSGYKRANALINSTTHTVTDTVTDTEIVSKTEDNLTIVTGYLHIKIKRSYKRETPNQMYDYLEKSRGTLQIPQYMVIYCSEELIDDIHKIREEAGLLNKTKIIKITLENNLYMVDKLDKIRENVAKNNPPYDLPEYILAVNSRYGYIQNAIENNYFNTEYFAWLDFSLSHIVDIPPNKIIEPKSHDKVRIGWIARYTDNQIVYNHYCLGGGIFSGHKKIMMELIKIHHIEFVKLTEMGYNINDDKLLYIIMEKNPYLFDTYFSYYNNLFIRL